MMMRDSEGVMRVISPIDELRRSRKSMGRLRLWLGGLSAVLAVVLVVSGAVVIGVLIGVMGVVRAAMIVRWQRLGATLGTGYRGNRPVR